MPSISNPAFAALAAGALAATVIDLRTRRIPNMLTAAIAGIGIGFAASGISGVSVLASMAGFALGLALMMPGHVLGATLAGTGRLIAAPAEARGEIRQAAPISRFAYGPAIAIGSILAALVG